MIETYLQEPRYAIHIVSLRVELKCRFISFDLMLKLQAGYQQQFDATKTNEGHLLNGGVPSRNL